MNNSDSSIVPSPTVTVTNDTVAVNGSATLSCTGTFADNLISPMYSWSPLTGNNSMLELMASLDNAGQHNCTVTGFYPGSNSAHVTLPAPVITPAYLTVNGKYYVYTCISIVLVCVTSHYL